MTRTALHLDPADTELWRAWSGATRALAASLDKVLTEHAGVSLVEFEMLSELVLHGEPLRSCDLGRAVSLTRSGATRAIARLERAGLVVKSPSDTDGRSVVVELTDEGRERHGRAAAVFAVVVNRDLVGAVPATDRDGLVRSLDAVRASVQSGPICQEALAEACR